MSQQELLKRIVQILDSLQIEYMVTGSVTSSLQGEPRSTHDLDLVVDLTEGAADRLRAAFLPSDFYVSDQAIERLGDPARSRIALGAVACRGVANMKLSVPF